MSDQLDFLLSNQLNFLIGFPGRRPGGLLMSLMLAVAGISIGFALALPLSLMLASRRWPLRWAGGGFVNVFRGVPLILLLVIIHQFLGGRSVLGFETTTLTSAVVALVLYSAAYQADIVTAGFDAVPRWLIDDARVFGASPPQVFWRIRLPYATRVMQPALAGQSITLFKDTSVVLVLGVADLTTTARLALGADVTNAPFWVATYVSVGFIYFLVAFGFSRLARRREVSRPRGGLIGSAAHSS